MKKIIEEIKKEVELEYQTSGLSDGLYGDCATEVAKRYAVQALKEERTHILEEVEKRIEDICNHAGDYTYHTLHETITTLLREERERIRLILEKIIDENDDGMWGCRETLDDILKAIE